MTPTLTSAALSILQSAGLTCPVCKSPPVYDWDPQWGVYGMEWHISAACHGCDERVAVVVLADAVRRATNPEQPYIDAVRLLLDKWPTPAERQ